jgi:hypothetical protein
MIKGYKHLKPTRWVVETTRRVEKETISFFYGLLQLFGKSHGFRLISFRQLQQAEILAGFNIRRR